MVNLSETYGRTRLSFADSAEIDEFVETLGRYERGEMSADAWRQYRLIRGTYGQRQTDDAQMVRVKIPQGILTGDQLAALAEVGERYSRGFGHITTRQNIQFHFVRLHDAEHAMRRLADAGLTTREACGSAVRNITACPYAGISADEPFDVTPYAEALTRFLLRHPLSSTLPRKFKIAFEGCSDDHVATSINDLGFRAVAGLHGGRGFRVTAGGGTSILCTSGTVIHEFLPASEIFRCAEAVLRVFQRLGDYQHKQRNRMKFLIRELGWAAWLEEYTLELSSIRAGGATPVLSAVPEIDDAPPAPAVIPVLSAGDDAFLRWRTTNVRAQKQPGFAAVAATVPLGDLTSAQMRALAEIASAYGDGTVRLTGDQDVLFRWVPDGHVRRLYGALSAARLGLEGAGTIADIASCPGAESCRLAVTHSRGLGRALEEDLRARPDLIDAAEATRIKISGCPNGCGQHHIATVGFQGSVRRLGDRAVPQYFVMVGGRGDGDRAAFGRLAAKIPARRASLALERLIGLFNAERQEAESAPEFFARVEVERVRKALGGLEELTEEDAVPADFVDLGEEAEFVPEVLEGECSV